MSRGRRSGLVVRMLPREQIMLTRLARQREMSAVLVRRARVLLLVAAGHRIVDVCAWTGMSRPHIYALAQRWADEGLAVVSPRRSAPWIP
jgi:Winged helix-turn helix